MPPRRPPTIRSLASSSNVAPTTSRPSKTKTASTISTDSLASALSSTLVLNDKAAKRKQKVEEPPDPEETCLAAMRAVNTASKRLSGIIASGWQSTGGQGKKREHTVEGVRLIIEDTASQLNVLRGLKTGDLDVERAASSVVGKVLSLELYDAAVPLLMDMHDPLIRLYCPTFDRPSNPPPDYFITLPPMLKDGPSSSEIIISLVSSYFVHVLMTFLVLLRSPSPPPEYPSITVFASSVNKDHASNFLGWLPQLAASPSRSKAVDSACTKLYTSFSKTSAHLLHSSAPSHRVANPISGSAVSSIFTTSASIFQLRTCGLVYLAWTSPGTVESEAFWGEVGKSVAECRDTDTEAQALILRSMDAIVSAVERREDRAAYLAPEGKRFRSVLDGWLSFARTANDVAALDRISHLLGPSLAPEASCTQTAKAPRSEGKYDHLEATRTYTSLSRTEAMFSQDVDVTASSALTSKYQLAESLHAIRKSAPFLVISTLPDTGAHDESAKLSSEKVRRAFERVRRVSTKAIETSASPTPTSGEELSRYGRSLLQEIADVLELVMADLKVEITSDSGQAFLLSWLDTLFVLSKTSIVLSDPDTYDSAFRSLERGWNFFQNGRTELPVFANYLRILSGAFYSLAGTLYRSGKYASASRFLERGCTAGTRAIHTRRPQTPTSGSDGQPDKDQEAWTALEEGLYKRWEVLGVCHSKTGDRKLAYQAFLQSIKSYPFFTPPFLEVANGTPGSLLFSSFPTSSSLPASSPFLSASVTQLGVLIDRITYMGTCELFLSPEEISLRPHFTLQDDSTRIVVGALLERQLQSLEPSRYKPAVKNTISVLLKDALDVYSSGGNLPIRRSGVCLKWLEGTYFGSADSAGDGVDIKSMGDEVQKLLSREDFSMDTPIIHLRAQYQVMLHLWLALHIHRSGNASDYTHIAQHAEEACKVLKAMLHTVPHQGLRASLITKSKMVSPKQIAAPAKKVMGRSTTKVKATTVRTRVAKTIAVPVTPKSRKPLQASKGDLSTKDPPSYSPGSSALASDGFAKLCDLLQMTSQLLGLLGHVVTKVHLLNVTRRLCERHVETRPEDFVQVSLDLGHEYASLGKTERAANIYASVRQCISKSNVADELRVLYFLRYSELLGTIGNVLKGSSNYCEATALLERLDTDDEKAMSTIDRVSIRVTALDRVAVAACSFATLQYSKDDPTTSLNGLLQALRLYHRAIDTFTRFAPTVKPAGSDNPFDMTGLKDVLQSVKTETPGAHQPPAPDQPSRKTYARRSALSSLEWRVASGLLSTLFALAQAYQARGSAREAEYFVAQAKDLAESLSASAMICRAVTRLGELKLCLGKMEEARECLKEAAGLVEGGVGGVDAADLRRLKGEMASKSHSGGEQRAKASYDEAMKMLEDIDELLSAHDTSMVIPRRSSIVSPRSSLSPQHDSLMPSLFVAVLRRNITLLHGAGEEFRSLLDRLRTLPTNAETKAEESSLFAKLTLDDAYARFRADMLLGSLAESTITLPMGMTGECITASATTQEILGTLSTAEKLFWSDLALVARRGRVSHVRDAVVSLALIKAFQTSLGHSRKKGTTLTARLLDSSAAITPRREMLEVIQHKFPETFVQDDLQWPLMTANGSVIVPQAKPAAPKSRVHKPRGRLDSLSSVSDADDGPDVAQLSSAKSYWEFIASRYNAQLYDPLTLRTSQTSLLPSHWSVISITLTSDQKSLFVTRQRRDHEPLIFCIPLKGRRETSDDEDDEGAEPLPVAEGGQLGYVEVIQELNEVIRLSDDGTRGAVNVDKNDKHARAKWWKERSELDKRMKTLLENIEFCWLGAFKTILSEPTPLPPTILEAFRSRLEGVFVRTLLPPAPGPPQSRPKHKAKSSSSAKNAARLDVTLSDTLLETFANLSPIAPSEELEDLAYFILDLYAFHGGPKMGVVVAEVDMDVLVLDIRGALEEVSVGRQRHLDKLKKAGKAVDDDHHTFLVLDKNMQSIPWECIPIMRGKSVSRIPSMEFLIDRILWAKHQRGLPLPSSSSTSSVNGMDPNAIEDSQILDNVENVGEPADDSSAIDRVTVDPTNTYVILNPSGDLKNTEGRFLDWVSQMQKGAGWEAVVGRAPSETEMANALASKDLVIYFGHGGAEQYIRSHKIRHLERCAATMLWGCSSGIMREMGDFDRVGTPLNYIMAGCPTLIANLWDVTDRDIDKFSQEVFDKVHLTNLTDVKSWRTERTKGSAPMSIVRAVAESRDVCKLKYLTGAAPVVYGIPFYL